MTSSNSSGFGARLAALLLAGTALSGLPVAAQAQAGPPPQQPPAAAPQGAPAAPAALTPEAPRVIKTLRVEGAQRIEPETVLSYTRLRIGESFTNETLDQAVKDLFASDLFADVAIDGALTGEIVVRVRENPIINRVIFEGNKRLKQDKIDKEIKLKPRQIFTRSAVRQDIQRLIELYRRQGRFAAVITPKMVSLDQNRVDVIFEVNEGPKSKVRQINIIGNQVFSDSRLRAQMATKQARLTTFLSSNTSYDQDRLAYDQQKLRQFYLTQGYADFKVTSAVAELTPDKRDFIITYVVEEGKRYHFGAVTVDSEIRDFDNKGLASALVAKKGNWYNAKQVEDSVEAINQAAGLVGYAFAEVNPEFQRDPDTLTMSINFHISQAQRTYVERIDINGNTLTQDKVIRREIRIAEGDAFNSFLVKRSQDRINSLGFFQDKLEIQQKPGSAPDRVVLETNVEERSTGQLNLSVGFSSLERFIISGAVQQSNFRGKGQQLRLSANWSTYSKSVEAGFTDPYLFDRNIALGFDIFRRDFNNFNFIGTQRNTTFSQVSTGFLVRAGLPLTEYWSFQLRYGLTYDQISLDRATYFTDGACDPLRAGRYLCEQLGNRLTSSVGFTLLYDSLNSRLFPTAGRRVTFNADLAGLGGDVKYARAQVRGAQFWNIGRGFIFSLSGEGGYIVPLQGSPGPGIDAVRINDRFYLGEPQFRGFDIRGVGPRIRRVFYDVGAPGQVLQDGRNQIVDDALGGRTYYLGRAEVQLPLGSGVRELGIRPSIYVDIGGLFNVTRPLPTASFPTLTFTRADGTTGTYVGSVFTPILDANGNRQYTYQGTDSAGNPFTGVTTCAAGSPDANGACIGTDVNPLYQREQTPFVETFLANSATPRISVGIGANWNSPFGPLRIDLARVLVSQFGEDTKLITFNVGTQF